MDLKLILQNLKMMISNILDKNNNIYFISNNSINYKKKKKII